MVFCLYCIAYWYCLLAPVIPVWNKSTVLFRCGIAELAGGSHLVRHLETELGPWVVRSTYGRRLGQASLGECGSEHSQWSLLRAIR